MRAYAAGSAFFPPGPNTPGQEGARAGGTLGDAMNSGPLTLVRQAYVPNAYTVGRLFCRGFSCWTLERPWLGNRPYESCVPCGNYPITIEGWVGHDGKRVVMLHDVPDRSAILIHPGNWVHQSQGCILPGAAFDFSEAMVRGSGETLSALIESIVSLGHKFISIQNTTEVFGCLPGS